MEGNLMGRGGRAPRGRGRGRRGGRGRIGYGRVGQQVQITVENGDDIVSSIESYPLQNVYSSVLAYQAIGTVSQLTLDGRGLIDAGNYSIQSLRGRWSEGRLSGARFFLHLDLYDLINYRSIIGNSRYVRAAANVRIFLEV